MAFGVKIPAQRRGWLGFDLADLLTTIEPPGDLEWRLSEARMAWDDAATAERWQAIAYDSTLPGGVDLKWGDLEELAARCHQVVEGTFTGFRGSEPIVQLRAVYGSYWIVWSRNFSLIERVRTAFDGVEDFDERTPHR